MRLVPCVFVFVCLCEFQPSSRSVAITKPSTFVSSETAGGPAFGLDPTLSINVCTFLNSVVTETHLST